MKREPKKRIIFSNYDTTNYEENVREYLKDENGDDYEPSDSEFWDRIYDELRIDWENEYDQLNETFDGNHLFVDGSIGRWDGIKSGFDVFGDFKRLFQWAVTDCDYWEIYDENGHLFLRCSHHDGTNHFEIKVMTDKGVEYLENWENNWDDKRSQKYIHEQLYKRYTKIPRYVEKVFGCPKTEFV